MERPEPRSSLATVISVAVCAYSARDLIHEVAGHGIAAWLTPGVRAISLTTVALQTTGSSRIVAAAGTVANLVAGVLALVASRTRARFRATHYFLLLLAAVTLLNATGYLLFSAVFNVGDWSVVVAGWSPAAAWRTALGVAGLASYVLVVMLVAREFARQVVERRLAAAAVPRLVFPAYLADAMLLVAGAALNPIDPSLILMSGVSTGFGAMAGLLFVPGRVESLVRGVESGPGALRLSRPWVAAGVLCATLFVGVVGRGIRW